MKCLRRRRTIKGTERSILERRILDFSTTMSISPTQASLLVAPSKNELSSCLNSAIVEVCSEALRARGCFTIALSGGSLPSFLSTVGEAFRTAGVDPKYDCWHVILADERCVPIDDPDCNMRSIQENFLSKVPIPKTQIHAIDESKLNESAEAVALAYEENVVEKVLKVSGGLLDLALLGFGPDGHTCSLFPGHPLLKEMTRKVAAIEDSPKPPPKRITLTFLVLNTQTRHVVFCGAGKSKSPVLEAAFSAVTKDQSKLADVAGRAARYQVVYKVPPPYPCAMVEPNTAADTSNSLTWVVDADAVEGVTITE